MNDADLQDWALRVWAAVEYGRNGVRTLRDFIKEYERDGIDPGIVLIGGRFNPARESVSTDD